MTYAIQFDWPEADKPCFAGLHKGAAGWAPTLKTAMFWDDPDDAARWLVNAYGPNTATYGRVVQVKAGYPVEF